MNEPNKRDLLLFANFIEVKSDVQALEIVIGKILEAHPVSGLPTEGLRDALARLKDECRSKIMIRIEETNPAFAALIDSLGEASDLFGG